MKQFHRGQGLTLGLALIAAGLAVQPALGASAAPAPKSDPSAVDQLRDAASGAVDLRANPATGKIGFARAEGANPDLLQGVAAEGRRGAIAKASKYMNQFAPAFGARANELKQTEVYADKAGWSVTFNQSYQGVPVFAGELKAHVDREGDLTSVNGFVAPALSLNVTPKLSKTQASQMALAAVQAQPSGYEDGGPTGFANGLTVRKADLTIYRTGSPRGITGEAKLAWAVEVWNQASVRESLILDATTGKPLNRWSMMAHALDRKLYEASNNDQGTPDDPDDDTVDGLDTPVYSEGDAFPGTLDEDQRNEVLSTSEAYWLFRNTFGYNSWDGQSGEMITVNNDPRIDCPNANWNGVTTNYCSGVTGDDTVAHEWAHAYTESTSGLIYQWQAGAMNEAYSDIWGETVDMLNARDNQGGETQDPADKKLRTEGKCSDYTRSEIQFTITAPASVAGACDAAPASFGPVITQAGTSGTAVLGSNADGCQAFTADYTGKWVYVDRGTCTFATKTASAEAANAEGIIIGNNAPGAPFGVTGAGSIYGLMVSQADGTKFKTAGAPIEFKVNAAPKPTDPTYRWLSGESDPAFGGAIRDLWSPNCYGDPGKVSDAMYQCGTEDSGGVHTNSGVVNRTFAVLVDGLPGKVPAIGLDKAAWLFWHTQTNYLTPTSYFPDLADGLEASCTDLKGVTFEKATVGNPTQADGSDGGVVNPEVVKGGTTTADCAAVAAAIAETELRLDPTKECNWQPLLASGAPELVCGAGTAVKTTFSEDFEDGLAGWTQDEKVGTPVSQGIEWEDSTEAPGGHAGGVAFGPDPVAGNCGAPGDLTSRNGLISPDIAVPAGTTPRMSFEHYVATESTWDGGNLKVSVNGGDFKLVPAEAYLFNAPAGKFDAKTGPLAGEPGWTGTDGGKLAGSWGTTVVDLSKIAPAGTSLKFRFDMGRDGCNGVDGWYVDNIKVEACVDKSDPNPPTATPPTATPTATPTPSPDVKSWVRAKIKPKTPKFRRGFRVKIKVRAKNDITADGRVRVEIDGKKVATKRMRNGYTVAKVVKIFKPGKHTLVVKYLGTEGVMSSEDTVKFKIKR